MFLNLNNDSINGFIRWVLYFFIGFFPFVFFEGFMFYGTTSRAVTLLILTEFLVLVLGYCLFDKKNNITLLKSPLTLSLVLFFVISFMSGFFGVDFASSFWSKATRMSGLFYFIHLGVFYLFLTNLFKREGEVVNFLKVFLVGAGIFSIGALLSKDGFGIIFTSVKWTGFTFGNSSFAAMYLYAAFMVAMYFFVSVEKIKWWQYLLPFVFIINPYIININFWLNPIDIFKNPLSIIGEAQASSIATFASLFLLLVGWGISKIKRSDLKNNIFIGIVFLGIVIATIASVSLISSGGYLQDLYLKQGASNARPIVWNLSKESIKDYPYLGWGGDNFDRSLERHYDNSLLEEKNGAEPWFDRAHNVFIDQTVETGYIGLISYILVYLVVFVSMTYVVLKSTEKKHQQLAVIIIVYFVGHIMELQTAFDTTISYVPLVIMLALSTVLFHKTFYSKGKNNGEFMIKQLTQYFLGIFILVFFGYLFLIGTLPIVRANFANGAIRTAGSSEKRLPIYSTLFGSPVDLASFLWRTSTDFQRGIAEKPDILEDPKRIEGLKQELAVHVMGYQKYMDEHPKDYRVRVSLAGVYIYERLFEVDDLNKAHKVLDEAIVLSPEIPQAYWEKSVAYLYQGKFALARDWAKKAYDLNPDIEQSQRIISYIERSIKTFPEIDLYTFGQL